MKIAVMGGTGLIGSRVVRVLPAMGQEAVPHSRSTGVDVISGQGLAEAVAGADCVVDLTGSPTSDEASLAFFRTSTENLLDACRRGGVAHVVVLSAVGAGRVPELAYYRAKALQEEVLEGGGIPYSIVRATLFMEFMDEVMSWTTQDGTVRLPRTPVQPIAADDVAFAVAEVAVGDPVNGVANVAGPDVFPLDELGRITVETHPDGRTVVTDDTAGLFAAVRGGALTVEDDAGARIAPIHYRDWLVRRIAHA